MYTIRRFFYKKWKVIKNRLLKSYLKMVYGKRVTLNGYLGNHLEMDIVGNCSIFLGKGLQFRNYTTIRLREGAKLVIENNVFFNNFLSINCRSKIVIKKNCLFGENVKLYDHNHRFRDKNKPISSQGFSDGYIIIGENCWIGSNVTILKNVEIGNNVIIGANCVISKSIASNSIVKANGGIEIISF